MRACLAILLVGCGGAIGTPIKPPPASVEFVSTVAVTPQTVSPGLRVSMNIDVTNTGNLGLDANVALRVHDAKGEEIYTQSWDSVHFNSREDWNLTQNFLPPTNMVSGDATVELIIRGEADDAIYYDEPQAAVFSVKR